MFSRFLLGGTFVVFIGVIGVAFYLMHQKVPTVTDTPSYTATNTATSTANPGATTSSYTIAEVAQHNSASSCWAAINGNVYDLTAWINQHPGGPEHILAICGTDGSAAFNGQHSGDSQPQQELKNFLLGPLAN